MALECPICKYPFGSGGKRVCTSPPVALRCASRNAGVTCGFCPGLCNLPRNPSSNTDLGLGVTDVEAGDTSVSAAFAGLGSCLHGMWISRADKHGTPVQNREGRTRLALGLCFPFCPKPIRQRGLDRILNLERVYPAQPWCVPECRDGRAHARPSRDSGRFNILGNGIRKGLLSDTKSFGSCALRDESYEWALAGTDQHHIHDQTERRPRAADVSRGT